MFIVLSGIFELIFVISVVGIMVFFLILKGDFVGFCIDFEYLSSVLRFCWDLVEIVSGLDKVVWEIVVVEFLIFDVLGMKSCLIRGFCVVMFMFVVCFVGLVFWKFSFWI